jgi:hypothetical protein
LASSVARKAAQLGLSAARESWKAARGWREAQERQTVERRKPWSSVVWRDGWAMLWNESTSAKEKSF